MALAPGSPSALHAPSTPGHETGSAAAGLGVCEPRALVSRPSSVFLPDGVRSEPQAAACTRIQSEPPGRTVASSTLSPNHGHTKVCGLLGARGVAGAARRFRLDVTPPLSLPTFHFL